MATDNTNTFDETEDTEQLWEGWSDEDANRATEDADEDGGDFLKLREGDNVLRFIPALKGKPKYYKVVQHFVPEMRGQKGFSAVCTMHTAGVCPICELAVRLASSGSPTDGEFANKMKPRTRYMYAASRRRSDGTATVPKVLTVPPSVHTDLSRIQADRNNGGDFTDPSDKGFDVVIHKEGSGINTEYTTTASRRSSPLAADSTVVRSLVLSQPDIMQHTLPIPAADLAAKLGAPVSASASVPRLANGKVQRVDDDLENWSGPRARR